MGTVVTRFQSKQKDMVQNLATALQLPQDAKVVTIERPHVRLMARLFFATFWLIIFTGAIRKWMFPNSNALYLLQDVPIAIAYTYALITGQFTRSLVLIGIFILSVILVLQALLQIVLIGLSPLTAVVGLHHYLFYLPMMVVFPVVLDAGIRQDFIRWNLLLALPMCALGIAQSVSPSSAFVNQSSTGAAFTISEGGISRGTGTFNFTSFYALWLGLAFALCIGEWLLPQERRSLKSRSLHIACTMALLLAALVSAERTALVFLLIGVLGGILASVLLGATRPLLVMVMLIALLPIGAGLTALISPDEYAAFNTRITSSNNIDDGKSRISNAIVGFLDVDLDPIGAGIGVGIDAAHIGEVGGYDATYQLAEQDIIRTVMELGTFAGLIYAFVRIGFVIALILLAVSLVLSGCSPHVLPLAFVVFAQGYTQDMTRYGTMTTTQMMLGAAFILGVFYFPDNSPTISEDDSKTMTRFA